MGLREKVINSTLISVTASITLKGLSVVEMVVFARLFIPSEMGVFFTTLLVVSFVMLFGQTRIDQSIIRQKQDPEKSMNTALTINFLVSGVLFVILFLSAPFVAWLFSRQDLSQFIRFLSFLAFGSAFGLPGVLWTRNLRFGISRIPAFIEHLVRFVVTILLFYQGMGIWSLFWGKLLGFVANYLVLWGMAPCRPRFAFDRSDATELFSFGWPLFISGLSNYFIWQGDDLLVRYYWGDESLAYYTLAFSLPYYLKELVDLICAVLYPAFAKVQDSHEKLAEAFAQSSRYLAFIAAPISMGLCVFAPQIIHYIYSDQWASAVPLLRLFAISFLLAICLGYNWGSLALARARTKYLMFVNLGTVGFLATGGWFLISQYGPIGGAFYGIAQVLLNVFLAGCFIIYQELGTLSYLKEVWKPILASVVAGLLVLQLVGPFLTNLALFMAGVVLFLGLYLTVYFLMNQRMLVEMIEIWRMLLRLQTSQKEG